MDWIEFIVLGIVQGLTEFLPVSSDGHLLVAETLFAHARGISRSGEQNLLFDVILHIGTTVAIVLFYRREVLLGVRGLMGSPDVPEEFTRPRLVRVGVLLFMAVLPLIPVALFLKKAIESTFEGLRPAGFGFMATSVVLLLTTWLGRKEGKKGLLETTWLDALLIGIAQTLAPLPGVSRSGLTIAAALALGLSRTWAVGFSLLLAVPTIAGAVVFKLKDMTAADWQSDRFLPMLAGTVLAGIVGYYAILWLVRVVRSGRLWYFSVYLLIAALIVLLAADRMESGANAGPANPLSRAAGLRARDPGDPGARARQSRALPGSFSGGRETGDRPGGARGLDLARALVTHSSTGGSRSGPACRGGIEALLSGGARAIAG